MQNDFAKYFLVNILQFIHLNILLYTMVISQKGDK